MNVVTASCFAAILAASPVFAAEAFPKQPRMESAYEKINAALTKVEKGRAGERVKHKKDALVDLAMARNFLEDAAKNKGSYRLTAINLVDQAKQELEAVPEDDAHLDKAADLLKKALDELKRGAHAARH